MNLQPTAILFDLDGVLIDSLNAWLAALNNAFEHHGYNTITKAEFFRKYWGYDLRDNVEKMKISQEVSESCNNFYGDHLDKISLYPTTKKTLEQLKHYKKALITNTPRKWTLKILHNFDLKHHFNCVVTSDDVTKAKPSPEIVYKACNYLQVQPVDSVLVGDTPSDIKAGTAAGTFVIGVNIPADITIKNVGELPSLLK